MDQHGCALAGSGRGRGGSRGRSPRRRGTLAGRAPLCRQGASRPRAQLFHLPHRRRAERPQARLARTHAPGGQAGPRDHPGERGGEPHHRGAPACERRPADAERRGPAARLRDPGVHRLDPGRSGVGGDHRAAGHPPARGDGRRARLLVVPAAGRAGGTRARTQRMGPHRHRPLRACEAGGEGARAAGACESPPAHPARHLRPHRPASDPRGSRGLRRRHVAGRLREGRGATADLTPLRRALGPALAGRGPLRRGRHPRAGAGWFGPRALPQCPHPARLGGRGLQPRHALRPLRQGADRGRSAGGSRTRTRDSRPGLPGRRPLVLRHRRSAGGAGGRAARPGRRHLARIPGPHGGVRPLPRPQVRPHRHARLLRARRHLQQLRLPRVSDCGGGRSRGVREGKGVHRRA